MSEQPEEYDEETKRLLNELEEQTPASEEEQQAPEGNSNNKKKRKKKASKTKAQSENNQESANVSGDQGLSARVITNNTKYRRRINAVEVGPGESYELTDRDLADEHLMAKINHMVKLGVLIRGTD